MVVNWLEVCGVVFGVGGVWLTIRQNIWCWPVGLVNIILYLYIFFQVRLYADMGLQAFYIVVSLYGWWHWLHGHAGPGPGPDNKSELTVSRLHRRHGLALVFTGLAAIPMVGWILESATDADIPYWDSAATVVSLIAQWLMARKVLECWLVWIAVDTLYVAIFIYKGLYPTAALYAFFLVLAALGFIAWKKSLK